MADALATPRPLLLAIAVSLLGIASFRDFATRTIPDLAPLGLIPLGIALRVEDGTVAGALVSSSTIFALAALCWRCGWLGGGDAKLLAACTLLFPPALAPWLVATTALIGGVQACLYLALHQIVRGTRTPACLERSHSLAARICRAEAWRIRRRASLPYGCSIAAACLVLLAGG